MKGVTTNDIAAELLDLCGNRAIAIVLAVGFTPSDDPGIGLDAREYEVLSPPGMHRQAFELGNLHAVSALTRDCAMGGLCLQAYSRDHAAAGRTQVARRLFRIT